jgi:hypothetical protein
MTYSKMSKDHLLAAETFFYSYANYANHLGIGNARFDKLMPNDVKVMQTAEKEGWDIERLAEKLELEVEDAQKRFKQYQRAKEVVFAENAATSFQIGVKHSIENALEQGLSTTEDINALVKQISYRVADLAYLLDAEGKELSDYSERLRGRNF